MSNLFGFATKSGAGLLRVLLYLTQRIGTLLLAVCIAWLCWTYLGPQKPAINPGRQNMANIAVQQIVEDLRGNRSDYKTAALLHFSGDPTGCVTDALRAIIEQRGTFDLQDRTLSDKVRTQLNMRQVPCDSAQEAIEIAGNSGLQSAIIGRVHSFEMFADGADLDVGYSLVDLTTGDVIYSGRYVKQDSRTPVISPELVDMIHSRSWLKPLLAWSTLTLLLPIFTIGFIRAMVARQSNGVNAFVLGLYTLANLLFGILLLNVVEISWPVVLAIASAIVIALLYNIQVMTLALKLEE